jgi:ABC-type polysaccharide/polyol phosphate transport system ATPase subunit
MTDAVVVTNVGKRFRLYHADRPQTLHEALLRGFRNVNPSETFWGLQDVTFRVPRGRMIGVIGRNGAGKSTLLRLIGGIGRPDRGKIELNGRLGALLSLGVGFHSELTGRENLYISGVIGGLTRREVRDRFDSIVDFAELHRHMDSPLRTYSSGMQMRLAFSVAVHTDPEILLIDEVLAVGDHAFQRKCLDRINQLRMIGCTIVLVTHEHMMVQEMCDEALWLRGGRLVEYGPAEAVVHNYIQEPEAKAHFLGLASSRAHTVEETSSLRLESTPELKPAPDASVSLGEVAVVDSAHDLSHSETRSMGNSTESPNELPAQEVVLEETGSKTPGELPSEILAGSFEHEAQTEVSITLIPSESPKQTNPLKSLDVDINSVRLFDSQNTPTTEIDSGDSLDIEIGYLAKRPLDTLNFLVYLEREDGTSCFELMTQTPASGLCNVVGHGRIVLHLDQLDLTGGQYHLDVGAFDENWFCEYLHRPKVASFTVRPTGTSIGILRPPHRWESKQGQA